MAKKTDKLRSLKKYEALPPELLSEQDKAGVEFRVGDTFFNYNGENLYRIVSFSEQERWADNDYQSRKTKKVWVVGYVKAKTYEGDEWNDDVDTEDYSKFVENVRKSRYTKLDRPFEQIMQEANDVIAGKIDVAVYSQDEASDSLNDETALIGRDTKTTLVAIQKSLEQKKQAALLVHKAVKFEMEKRKAELEVMRQKLYGIVAEFKQKLKKIMRVITTIELYLGIEEELHQIQEGEKAPVDTPISFRQMVLYIDEEVGAHEDGGLDFNSIEQFDSWLVTGSHLDIVLPEKKGIVVMNPRRHDKDYGFRGKEAWLNSMINIPNHTNTYILIRNGDCVYRIFTKKLVIKETLFPLRKEMAQLAKKMRDASFDRERDEVEDQMYQYKKQGMLLQGLVDRTDVFHPLPVERLNIFKLGEAENYVNFVYDAEASLPSGRLSFQKWQLEINSKIGHGSRIYITSGSTSTYQKYHDYDRIYFTCNEHNYPPSPPPGIYEVEEYKGGTQKRWLDDEPYKKAKADGLIVKDVGMSSGGQHIVHMKFFYEQPHLTIMYNPGDEVQNVGWEWDPHERKKRIRYRIYPDDGFVLNYDQLLIDDLYFYLHSRVDREKYLSMMPVIKEVIPKLRAEQKLEDFFAEFVFGRNEDVMLESELRKRIAESIRWWKYKNKWKRAINKDDTLALRMIEQRVLSPNYKTFKLH